MTYVVNWGYMFKKSWKDLTKKKHFPLIVADSYEYF